MARQGSMVALRRLGARCFLVRPARASSVRCKVDSSTTTVGGHMLKRSTFLAALIGAALFSSSLMAGETTKADHDALVAHLKKTEAAFLKSIEGVSDAQWKWKSAPDR